MAEEARRRPVGAVGERAPIQGRPQATGQRLAEFHSPLVERVDVPEHPLDECSMLEEGDQPAKGPGVEAWVHDGGRGPVSGERAMGGQALGGGDRDPRRHHLAPSLLPGASEGERLSLGEAACQEDPVVFAARFAAGLRRNDEIHRYDVRPLVEKLEEGMLRVGAGLAPHDRGGRSR